MTARSEVRRITVPFTTEPSRTALSLMISSKRRRNSSSSIAAAVAAELVRSALVVVSVVDIEMFLSTLRCAQSQTPSFQQRSNVTNGLPCAFAGRAYIRAPRLLSKGKGSAGPYSPPRAATNFARAARTSSRFISEVSRITASSAGRSGAIARLRSCWSRRSTSSITTASSPS